MPKSDTVQFWVLNLASFFSQLVIAMINLALIYHLRHCFALRADQIGVAASITPASYLVFCLIGGRYTPHFRPRHLVETSLLGMAASVTLLAHTRVLAVAYLALVLYGAFMSLLWPQIEAWFSRGKEGEALNRVANAFNVSWSLGIGVSSYAAGLLVEVSTTIAFTVGIAVFIAVFLMIAVVSSLVPSIRAVDSERRVNRRERPVDQSTVLRFYAWGGIITLYTGMSIILTIFPLYAQDVLLLSESSTGLLLLFRGVSTCLSFFLLGKLHFWQFKKGWIFAIQAAFGLLCLVAMRFHSAGLFSLFFILFGILFAFAYTQSMFHGVSGAVHRSRRMIIHEVLLTVGTILGAVGGGAIYERLSFSSLLALCGIVALAVVALEMIGAVVLERRRA
ncbi:MAG TPA: MFS transporter [Sphaerochaeta sp.]|nr:MFS transporter [Sphaerochaeta sp.]